MKLNSVLATLVMASQLVLTLCYATPAESAECTANVPSEIKTPEGRAFYLSQYAGCDSYDGLGTTLPPGLTANEIVSLIAPGKDPSISRLVGAKKWRRRENSYVVIACFALDKNDFIQETKFNNKPDCSRSYDTANNKYLDKPVYLGVIEYKPGVIKPRLIARYDGPLDIRTDWRETEELVRDKETSELMPDEYSRFDLAPYKITDTDTAFGLRLGWHIGYAGGGAYYESLALFEISGNKLNGIFAEPMYSFEDIAGEWHDDGTRSHDISETRYTVSVSKHKEYGHYELEIKGGGFVYACIWNDKTHRYDVLYH